MLNDEVRRIKSECADIVLKTLSGQTCLEQIHKVFPTITPKEYAAADMIYDRLLKKRRGLQKELEEVNLQIRVVKEIICKDIY